MDDKYPKDTGCALHPSCVACPEPICAFEYPGGFKAYLKKLELEQSLREGCDIVQAAKALGIHKRTAERRFNKSYVGVS